MANVKLANESSAALVNANGAAVSAGSRSALSAEYDNSTNLDPLGRIELVCAFGTAPTAGRRVNVYLIPCNDGTNYTDGSDTVVPAANLLVGWTYVRSVTGNQRMTFKGNSPDGRIHLPACKFKLLIENLADQGIGANWSLTLFPSYYTVG